MTLKGRAKRRGGRRDGGDAFFASATTTSRFGHLLLLFLCLTVKTIFCSSETRTTLAEKDDATRMVVGEGRSRRERLAEEAELVARLARVLVEEERALEEEDKESVAMPRGEGGVASSSSSSSRKKTKTFAVLDKAEKQPQSTKNPDAKFLYDLAKAFVRTARQHLPKEVAESDDYAMQARYQASRCARSADATLSLDWFFEFMDELVAKEEMGRGGGGNHYNSRMYKGGNVYRPEMYATSTANGEESAMMPVEDLFLLRARSYYYANKIQAHESRAALSPFCGSIVGFSVASAIWMFSFFPVILMSSAVSASFVSILAVTSANKCSASNCFYPRKCCDLTLEGKGYETCAYHFSICPDYCGHEGDDDGQRCDSGPPHPQNFRAVNPQFVESYERFCCNGICCPTGFVCCDKEDAVGKVGPKCEKVEMCVDSKTNKTKLAPGRLRETPQL